MMNRIREILKEFRDFAVKGDAFTLAIGVVIGTAFKTVIDSLVKDIILPPINFFTEKVDFTNLYFTFGNHNYSSIEEAEQAGAIVIRYGSFLTELIVFIITAFAIFLFVYKFQKMMSKKHTEEKKAAPTKKCRYCQMEISAKATRCPHCTSKL